MTVYISEHYGNRAQERWSIGPPLLSYTLSSASTPTLINAATSFVRVTTDSTAQWFGFTGSTGATPAVNFTSTMTNLFALIGGAPPQRIPVPSGTTSTGGPWRMWAASTST